jgi:hypothetical protein
MINQGTIRNAQQYLRRLFDGIMQKYLTILFLLATLLAKSQGKLASGGFNTPEIEGGDGKKLVLFFKKFRSLVKENDSSHLANHVFYPLHAASEGFKGSIDIYDKKSFLKYYHLLFSERMRKYILSENLDSVFSNYQGIAIGRGRIWIGQRMIRGELVTKVMSISNLDVYWKSHK